MQVLGSLAKHDTLKLLSPGKSLQQLEKASKVSQTHRGTRLPSMNSSLWSSTAELQRTELPGSISHEAEPWNPAGRDGHRAGRGFCSLQKAFGCRDGDGTAATCCGGDRDSQGLPAQAASHELFMPPPPHISMPLRQRKWSNSFCPLSSGKACWINEGYLWW